MLIDHHHTDGLMTPQALSLVGDPWTTDVVPRLPATLAAPARVLKAFQRVRGWCPARSRPRLQWRSASCSWTRRNCGS